MKKKKIRAQFHKYVIKHCGTPKKLKHFLKFAHITKEEFHEKYDCLRKVELDIWKTSLQGVLTHLGGSNDYCGYSHRDKGLSFMYSWLEFMDQNSPFFKNCSDFSSCGLTGKSNDFKKILTRFVKNIIKEGVVSQEFKDRGIKAKYMSHFFVGLFFMVLKQWKQRGPKKKKKQEEFMDALVEKSMLFFFDSLAPNLFDSFIDLMKHRGSKK